MTSLVRGFLVVTRSHARKTLVLLALVAGMAGGVGLYVGVDGYYVRVSASYASARAQVQPLNGNPRLPLKTISIPISSLQPVLAKILGQDGDKNNGSIKGYAFRSAWNTYAPVCLGAENTGIRAGENADPVMAFRCSKLTRNEIWIPAHWDKNGTKLTWLVNYQYQSKCMNVDNIKGLDNGHKIQLWGCHNGSNEFWDFGDWYQNMKSGTNPYPLFLGSSSFCLDADKYHLVASGNLSYGTSVHLWNYYATSNQYWY